MKNKFKNIVNSFILPVLLTTVLFMCISIAKDGMYLIGIPEIDEVQKVTIAYPSVSDQSKEITDDEHIELAVKLTGFLKYALFERADDNEEPMINITYFTSDGSEISVSANRETVWWKGKAYALKDDETFINLTESVFYLSDLVSY